LPRAEPRLDDVLAPAGWAYASAPPQAAGDPGRFHALFGRDSLIVALQVLPSRPDVARATLRAHAGLLGRRLDPATLEAPGKVVHEWRERAPATLVERGWPDTGEEFRYYATADATSWLLVVLAALGDAALADELSATWQAAAGWLAGALEDGGGLVRYGPGTQPGGLTQQGWRDAVRPEDPRDGGGGIVHPDGSRPASPLADADVQAVAHAALHAVARLSGDEAWAARARELQARIGEAFDPETMAVEPDGTRVRGAGSQLGWLLWAGALPAGPAREAAADRLCEPDVLTGFGLRTLAASAPHFDPHAYHRGSVWPFDSWLGWGGLRAAGRAEAAGRVRAGVLAALEELGHAPELYAVVDGGRPERIAMSTYVQAWTIGARDALRAGWDGRAGS
jgi:glycogen debranching enzyme